MSWLLILLLLAASSAALAWNEPTGFRDLPWGSSILTVQEKLPSLTCMQESCSGDLSLGSTKTYANVIFRDAGLDKVVLIFPSSSYSDLKPIFIERYGPPTTRATQELQNRMGARFENEILLWTGQKAHVRLERYRNMHDLANGAATIETKAGFEERARKSRDEEQERVKKGKKDL